MKKSNSKGSKSPFKAKEMEELRLLIEKNKLQNELLQKIIDNMKSANDTDEKK